ncbi:MAG TPA: type IV secretory system conjugative DNA transfer family protein [Pirellulales bacterium]|nr:type IV secretory system conjugative DNA transfer family protein [Pirellulales bacterium]
MANLFIEAFNLDNGLVYGGQYFTQQNLAALLDVVRAFDREKGHPPTLREISDYLDSLRRRKQREFRDADQIRMTFNFLLEYPQLQPTAEDKAGGRMIDMAKALDNEQGEVIYFFTPTLNESTTARQIAGLGLYSVINAAIEKRRADPDSTPPRQHIWIFVDEFHELAGRSFASLLAQAGKFGITLILANQTTDQLENRDTSLAQVVFDNCHVKQYFTVTSKRDIEDLQTLSKEMKFLLSTQTLGVDTSVSKREVLLPKLTKNRILNVSATKGHTFLIIDDGKGHKEPQRVIAKYATKEEHYLKDSYTRLPPAEKRQAATPPTQNAAPAVRPKQTTVKPERFTPPDRKKQLDQLLAEKQQAEAVA